MGKRKPTYYVKRRKYWGKAREQQEEPATQIPNLVQNGPVENATIWLRSRGKETVSPLPSTSAQARQPRMCTQAPVATTSARESKPPAVKSVPKTSSRKETKRIGNSQRPNKRGKAFGEIALAFAQKRRASEILLEARKRRKKAAKQRVQPKQAEPEAAKDIVFVDLTLEDVSNTEESTEEVSALTAENYENELPANMVESAPEIIEDLAIKKLEEEVIQTVRSLLKDVEMEEEVIQTVGGILDDVEMEEEVVQTVRGILDDVEMEEDVVQTVRGILEDVEMEEVAPKMEDSSPQLTNELPTPMTESSVQNLEPEGPAMVVEVVVTPNDHPVDDEPLNEANQSVEKVEENASEAEALGMEEEVALPPPQVQLVFRLPFVPRRRPRKQVRRVRTEEELQEMKNFDMQWFNDN